MPNSNDLCGNASPFMNLGDGDKAPSLNYNLPQNTCYRGNGYFPIAIDPSYFDDQVVSSGASSPWSLAEQMTNDQIESTLRDDVLRGNGGQLILNAHFFKYHSYLIRILKRSPGSTIVDDPKPEGYVVGDSNLRVANLTGQQSTSDHTAHKRVNHLSVLADHPAELVMVGGYTLAYLVEQVQNSLIPQLYKGFGGRVRLQFLSKPNLQPRLTLVEHYKMCSYLGDYGAGKTVKTFSLLPGERTSISVKSYKDKTSSHATSSTASSNEYSSTYYADDETSTAISSENILDSFSQYSADQLQSQIESIEGSSSGSSQQNYAASESGNGGGRGGGFNLFGLANWQGGSSWQSNVGSGFSTNAVREDHMSTLNAALESSVNESGHYRDVEVNTTTANSSNSNAGGSAGSSNIFTTAEQSQTMMSQGEATTTVRQLHNMNHSRTLNFVFRQMLQEHVVLTYLDEVSFVFGNGVPGQSQVIRLAQLYPFLQSILKDPQQVEEVFASVMRHLCNVNDYQGNLVHFAEKAVENLADCVGGGTASKVAYWRKQAGITGSYTAGGLELSVPGVITSVSSYILRTDSVIVDAILGQGEALDCYNTKMQEEGVRAAGLRNDQLEEQTLMEKEKLAAGLQVIAGIVDPGEKADAFRKIFGECCQDDLMLHLHQANA